VLGEERRTASGELAADVVVILDCDRQAREPARVIVTFALVGLGCARAVSMKRIGRALTLGSTSSMRAAAMSTISSGETSPLRSNATASVAESLHRVLMVIILAR